MNFTTFFLVIFVLASTGSTNQEIRNQSNDDDFEAYAFCALMFEHFMDVYNEYLIKIRDGLSLDNKFQESIIVEMVRYTLNDVHRINGLKAIQFLYDYRSYLINKTVALDEKKLETSDDDHFLLFTHLLGEKLDIVENGLRKDQRFSEADQAKANAMILKSENCMVVTTAVDFFELYPEYIKSNGKTTGDQSIPRTKISCP